MTHKRIAGMAALLVLLAFPVSASMVSFLLVETGLGEEAPNTQYSSLWEGGLMAAFFDAGHIVTNSPIARMAVKPDHDFASYIEDDFNEAADGGAEYFILGFLDYQNQGMVPAGITLKLYTIDSQVLIFEEYFPAGRGNLSEELQLARNAGLTIISQIRD